MRPCRWLKPCAAPSKRAARAAATAGAKVEDVNLPPIFEDAYRAHATVQEYEAYRSLAFEYDHFPDQMSKALREVDGAAAVTPEAYDAARRITKRARQALADLMTDIDALLTLVGTRRRAAWPRPRRKPDLQPPVDAHGHALRQRCGTLEDGGELPLGVQIVGRFGRDRNALEAALFLEKVIAKTGGSSRANLPFRSNRAGCCQFGSHSASACAHDWAAAPKKFSSDRQGVSRRNKQS